MVEISQNLVAFSANMNFNKKDNKGRGEEESKIADFETT